MIKALIFDWFGVCAERYIDVWRKKLPKEIKFEDLKEVWLRHLDSYAKSKITGKEFAQNVATGLNLHPEKYEHLIGKHGNLNVELLNKIRTLKKRYKIALLTDNFNEMIPSIENDIGRFDKYFDILIFSNREGKVKTEHGMFELTLRKLGEKAENCVFIDDRPKNIEKAKMMGLQTILFKNNNQLKIELEQMGVK